MVNFIFSVINSELLQHFGICDASAAIPWGEDRFFVGNDEDNVLRLYDAYQSGNAIKSIDINQYFSNDDEELDIEAATILGDYSYWITSHGRSKKGNFKEKRHQFFAVQFFDNDSMPRVVGKSYQKLVRYDMIESEKLKQFDLQTAEKIKPKESGGLNIEGLTTNPDGNILIAFRNPIPEKKALLVPLKNALELVVSTEESIKAELGEPILLDLDGLGIRSIEYWSVIQSFIIIAGPFDGGDRFALYKWSGNPVDKPEKIDLTLPDNFRPESVLFYPHLNDRFQLLSDDGSIIRVNNQPCKEIKESTHSEKYFRSIWIKVESK